MERRGCGLGCIVAGLGLATSCFLLPYLISSIYSIVSTVLQLPSAATWLWGDWLGTTVGADHPLYMFLAEGPICCVGILALLIVILGAVLSIAGPGSGETAYSDTEYEYEYEPYDAGADLEYGYDSYADNIDEARQDVVGPEDLEWE